MQIIHGKRLSTKDAELVRLADRYRDTLNRYILVATHRRGDALVRLARKLGVKIRQPITWHEFVSKKFLTKGVDAFLIDSIDSIFRMYDVDIDVISYTDL